MGAFGDARRAADLVEPAAITFNRADSPDLLTVL